MEKNIKIEEKEPKEKLAEEKTSKQKEKKLPIPIVKQYYTITLEVTAPITLSYRVLADDPEQALELIKNASLSASPKPHLHKMKKHKATVHMSGTSTIKLTKTY
jgi:hypothetical protein